MSARLATVVLCLAIPGNLYAGELLTEEIDSQALGRPVELNILLPDGYGENPERRYPAVYLLHGYGGNYSEWQRIGIVEEARKLPVIIVMPEGDQSFYINFHKDPQARWEDWITEEVPSFVESKYRTVPEREWRAISGLSMGGYGAMMLGLRHPELFASIASHSGALGILRADPKGDIGKRIAKIFGPQGSEERRKYDLLRIIRDLPEADRPHIYIDCGSSDFLLESNRDFVRELSRLKVDYEYREVPGAHNFAYWKANVRYSLTQQIEALKEAAKNPRPRKGPSIAGVWKARASLPEGGEADSVLFLTEKEGKLGGRIEWDEGEREADFDRVHFSANRLVVQVDVERDGRRGYFYVEARLVESKLVGKWGARGEDGEEVFSADWQAVREKPAKGEAAEGPGEPEGPRPAPTAAQELAGTWNVIVKFGGTELDYGLRIEEKDGKLAAVQISPRSGEHKFKSATYKDGQLSMAIERRYDQGSATFIYEGKFSEGRLSGKMFVKGYEDQGSGEWTARRGKEKNDL